MGMFCRIFTNLTWYLGSETAEIKTLHEHQIMGKMYENVIFETMEFGGPLFWDKPVRRRNIDKIPAILAEWCNSSTGNKGCLWSFSQKKKLLAAVVNLGNRSISVHRAHCPCYVFQGLFLFCKTVMSWTYVPKMLWLESVQNAGKNNKRLWPWAFLGTKKMRAFTYPI